MIEVMPRTLPYLYRERTRHGKLVWYVRRERHGKRVRIGGEFGSREFLEAYHAALADQAPAATSKHVGPGTLAWLVARYRESATWAGLSVATRYQREGIFRAVIEKAGAVPFRSVESKHVRQGREDRKATPFLANNFLKAMRGLFAWAAEAELVPRNPAADVDFLPVKTQGHEPWTMADVARYEARWTDGTRERIWLHVLLYTGLRLGDACTVGRQHVSDGWIRLRAEKTGALVEIPIAPALAATLATGPVGDMAWIATSSGRPFVKEAFGNAFRRACREAGIVGKSAHGLRKTLATRAAESGASEEELQAWFGWQSNRMSQVYTRSANRKRMASSAATKMFGERKTDGIVPHLVSGAGHSPKRRKK